MSWGDSIDRSFWHPAHGQNFTSLAIPRPQINTRPDGINHKGEIVGRFEPTGSKFEQSFEATY